MCFAVIALNGKPTEHNDLGRKVEFAMDLVSTPYTSPFLRVC